MLFKKLKYIVAIGGMIMCCILLRPGHGLAELSAQKQELQKKLRDSAEEFNRAYEKRDFKTMYQMLVPNYRDRVPFWEYKDFVVFPGVTNGYIKAQVMEASLLRDGVHGKVIRKILTFETATEKTSGETREKKQELMEVQDWILIKGTWYVIEKLNQ